MKTLETLQRDFYQALFQEDSTPPKFIASDYPTQRLATYRRNIVDNLRNALALTYPGIWTLLGDDCANSLARAFCTQQHNHPQSGFLDNWGAEFPDFLSQQAALNPLPYLKDYATYEWLKHLAYCAPASPAMKANELAVIPDTQLESMQLFFADSVSILHSDYPLDKIEHLIENPNTDKVNLNSNNTYALIARPHNTVHTFWISADLWLFIASLQQPLTLSQAYQKTSEQYPHFDLTAALQWIMNAEIIARIKLG